jgi:hypothetical protein
MSRRSALRLAAVATALVVCLSAGRSLFVLRPLSAHHGDGTFADITRRTPFALPGYTVSMPAFDLALPHQAEYRMSRLPDIGRDCGLFLAIRDPDDGWWGRDQAHLAGELRLELLDAEGRAVVRVNGRLGEYIWCGKRELSALYQPRKSFFRPDSRQEYRARVWYTPDPRLAGYEGFVYLWAGGTK